MAHCSCPLSCALCERLRRDEAKELRDAESFAANLISLPAVDDGRDTYDPTDDFYRRMEFDIDPWERYYDR